MPIAILLEKSAFHEILRNGFSWNTDAFLHILSVVFHPHHVFMSEPIELNLSVNSIA